MTEDAMICDDCHEPWADLPGEDCEEAGHWQDYSFRVLGLLEALLRSLPRCDSCHKLAMKAFKRGEARYCDDHAPDGCPDYPRAQPLRDVIAAFGEMTEEIEHKAR